LWFYNNEIVTNIDPRYIGYVYLITNILTSKKYIGKKLFVFKKTKTIKGKKKKYLVESDWKEYYGSSVSLKTDIDMYGKDNFKREILMFCTTKSECSYFEAKFQFDFDVLLNPNDYYNDWISCRIRRGHLLKGKL
jgi:hypothetical protein